MHNAWPVVLAGAVLGVGIIGCRPSDVLSVPPPAGVTSSSAYQNQSGAEGLETTGRSQVFQGFAGGVLVWSGSLADEFSWSGYIYDGPGANIDARITAGGNGYSETGDAALAQLLGARVTLLSALAALRKYEPPSGRAKIGEAYALIGYAELLLAEDYCAGVPLGQLVSGVGGEYGTPLTTDSLLTIAVRDLDSAVAYAGGSDTVAGLAAVGLGRAQLDRGHYSAAAAAVGSVPTGFVYNSELEPGGFAAGPPNIHNWYDQQAQYNGCGYTNVADRKGGNGMNFLTARDPRLVLDSAVAETCDGIAGGADSIWYYPSKFGNPSTYVALATGVEARLIEAEVLLHATQTGAWAATLNALRASAPATYLALPAPVPPLSADSTTGADAAMQLNVQFRERAFWLYGTGTRLGDLRRLIRWYGRDQSIVFPVGPYPHGHDATLPSPIPNYGLDVNLTLPTPASGSSTPNPNYRGCLTSTKTA